MNKETKSILITGVAGFIGSALAIRLLKDENKYKYSFEQTKTREVA